MIFTCVDLTGKYNCIANGCLNTTNDPSEICSVECWDSFIEEQESLKQSFERCACKSSICGKLYAITTECFNCPDGAPSEGYGLGCNCHRMHDFDHSFFPRLENEVCDMLNDALKLRKVCVKTKPRKLSREVRSLMELNNRYSRWNQLKLYSK